jgi:hypothetical protein
VIGGFNRQASSLGCAFGINRLAGINLHKSQVIRGMIMLFPDSTDGAGDDYGILLRRFEGRLIDVFQA